MQKRLEIKKCINEYYHNINGTIKFNADVSTVEYMLGSEVEFKFKSEFIADITSSIKPNLSYITCSRKRRRC